MDTKEFKKLLKSLKMPSSTEVIQRENNILEARWRKVGGFAGERSIKRVAEEAVGAGFRVIGPADSTSADGSRVTHGSWFSNDDLLSVTKTYGVTSKQNEFSIVIRTVLTSNS